MAGTATPTNNAGSANTWLGGLLSGAEWTSGANTDISVYIAGTSGDETLTHGGQSVTARASIAQPEIDAMNEAMAMIAAVCDVSFTSVGSQANADIIWAAVDNADGQGALGWANFPGGAYSATYGDYQSVIAVNQDAYVGPAVNVGGYDYITFIHELGHALGLSHPHDASGSSTVFPNVSGPFNDYGDYDMNQGVYTMMSYNDGWATAPHGSPGAAAYGWQGTPMALDIAALQEMYGANTSTATGNDTYTLAGSNAAGTYYECIWDAGGTDEIVGQAAATNTIDLRAATLGDEVGGGGFISYAAGIHGGFTIANMVVIENATGGNLADTLTGNDAANDLDGLGGADVMAAGAGADTVAGGAGTDSIDGGAGGDSIAGGADDDTVRGDAGDDALDGGSGADTFLFEGIFGNDTIAGAGADAGETANVISFGAFVTEAMITYALTGNNDDLLITVSGGSGPTQQSGTILIEGYATAQGGGGGFGSMVWTANGGGSVDLTAGVGANPPAPPPAPVVTTITGGRRSDYLTGTGDDELINTGAGNDRAFGMGGNDTVVGYTGADTLYGGTGDDSLTGDQKNDRLYGEGGLDTLDGGAGSDRLEGGDDADVLLGGNYDDTLYGDAGNDSLDGGAHADRLYGGAGNDTLLGGRDNDQLDGGAGDDSMLGEEGRDYVIGGDGADTLDGGADVDVLYGGAGADSIRGGAGEDKIYGEIGNDTLDGGGHADTYIFSGDFGHDTIVSLAGGDKIHLASFRAFKGAAMSMADLKLTQSGADVVIELDLDRNGIVDNVDYDADLIPDPVSVTVENMTVAALSASDFVL
ncbi:M10 family metallopeptidase [Acuticoccus sp. I52.16.1]|uniref:M10 family metallopeptidase n=1 Tax=Acuticoccus sp. I52.16.1 TaxID=2928472 RepID=UPI001FD27275|nr:M12 family metallo-peptidase [Acuticoccus sp. I52.16.1]UOM35352.1 M10 family metallopeptidase C-terminal domain-containing protein [Acuticoccus sp. I52.16.1]